MTDERFTELWNLGYQDGLDGIYDDEDLTTDEEREAYEEGNFAGQEDFAGEEDERNGGA